MNKPTVEGADPVDALDIARIGQLPLFDGLNRESRDALLEPALTQSLPAGSEVLRQGDAPDHLHVLLDGVVELVGQDGAGNEVVVEVVQPVDCFILAAVVTDAPYLMSARALEPCRLLLIPARHLRHTLLREPPLALALMSAMARHYRGMVRQIKDLKLRTSAERIASFLVQLAHEQRGTGQIHLPYPKRVLAERMGITPEHLSRAFAQLRDRGVHMRGSRIVIDDVDTLAAYSRVDTVLDSMERELRIPGTKP
ncbi:MAG: helix-turn-helix domain-containing protein [Ectothiorhodospiraceae bacterium]|nr:helix-turn-helix domain-containing protein [Ectothiorhodospiraceae bacterium]